MAILDRELEEAIRASEAALEKLEKAKASLESASGWGIFDIIGGGFISSAVKHSKVQQARNLFNEARNAVAVFVDELDDVTEFTDVDIDTGDALKVFDIFLDNVFVDILAQKKIREAADHVDRCIFQVRTVQAELIARYHSLY
ncbi:MAG: hypothetical protein IIY44_00265 [Erysipelotrichales bacterium]|nr:hypothetical protein [Erysipelotrichales bacterium]MBQ2309258.1 hypothetical protein [Erysipelotrichales bacterium]MBQ4011865.1 hypothetical protein [Erysipelotrichales bacterium]